MSIVLSLHKHHIRSTEKRAIVHLMLVLLCQLTVSVVRGIHTNYNRVYVSTRVMKHVYDKRPAQEYDLLIENLQSIVKFPDRIYKNKKGKRGEYIFIKVVKNIVCLCSIEILQKEAEDPRWEVVTFFTVEESYLTSYELLWEWKGDVPSS